MQVESIFFLGEALSAVREAFHDSETGLAHPASPSRFLTCTANAGTKKSRPRRGRAVNSGQLAKVPLRSARPISRTRWPTKIREVFEIVSGAGPDLALSEHGPCFVGGTVTLDDASFTMKIASISRDAGRRFVHHENRVYQSSNARLGEALGPSRFGDRQHCLGCKRLREYFRDQSSAYLPATSTGEHWQSGTLNARVQR